MKNFKTRGRPVSKSKQFGSVSLYNILNSDKPIWVDGKQCPIYRRWYEMIKRVVNEDIEQFGSYKMVSINKLWFDFYHYYEWFITNKVEGWEVDKDFLIIGNQEYGPHTCCFLPGELNQLFKNLPGCSKDLPIGYQLIGYGGNYRIDNPLERQQKYLRNFIVKLSNLKGKYGFPYIENGLDNWIVHLNWCLTNYEHILNSYFPEKIDDYNKKKYVRY